MYTIAPINYGPPYYYNADTPTSATSTNNENKARSTRTNKPRIITM